MDDTVNFEMQLCELELLMSMFPGSNELEFDDLSELVDLRKELDLANVTAMTYSGIGFTVRLSVQHQQVELAFRLSRSYPLTLPSVCLRSGSFSSSLQRKMNSELHDFMTKRLEEDPSSGLIIAIINWIRERVTADLNLLQCDGSSGAAEDNEFRNTSMQTSLELDFARLWIYSHHIYRREKRRTILSLSHDMRLTGFCAPGKPGVICVEGLLQNIELFWQSIRSLQWQRITLVHREDLKSMTQSGFDLARRFHEFEEKCFESHGSGASRGTHMDRGKLLQFLVEHGCGDIFQLYFGVGNSDCVK